MLVAAVAQEVPPPPQETVDPSKLISDGMKAAGFVQASGISFALPWYICDDPRVQMGDPLSRAEATYWRLTEGEEVYLVATQTFVNPFGGNHIMVTASAPVFRNGSVREAAAVLAFCSQFPSVVGNYVLSANHADVCFSVMDRADMMSVEHLSSSARYVGIQASWLTEWLLRGGLQQVIASHGILEQEPRTVYVQPEAPATYPTPRFTAPTGSSTYERFKANWGRISVGMTEAQVCALIGPGRLTAEFGAQRYYEWEPAGSPIDFPYQVTFENGRVTTKVGY